MTTRAKLKVLREARAILSVSALANSRGLLACTPTIKYSPPSYALIATTLGLSSKGVDKADDLYNQANGPDDWSAKCEEKALQLANEYIEMAVDDLEPPKKHKRR